MSDFSAAADISTTLRELLEGFITNSPLPELNGVPVDLRTPKAMRDTNINLGVSVYLYRIERSGDTLNGPIRRVSPTLSEHRGLPIILHYLISVVADQPLDQQRLLGRVLQVMNDHTVLRGAVLRGGFEDDTDAFRVNLEPMSMQDLARIWDAIQEPYLPSVSYEVQLITIDSQREPISGAPVLNKHANYGRVVNAEPFPDGT
jgi:hypothetical protein